MTLLRYIFTFVFIIIPAISHSEVGDKWLCIAEKAAGFSRNEKGEWDSTTFRTDAKWILEEVSEFVSEYEFEKSGDKYQAKMTEIGENEFWALNCTKERRGKEYYCGSRFRSIYVNIEELRFIKSRIGSYIFEKTEISKWGATGDNYLQIGECTKLQ